MAGDASKPEEIDREILELYSPHVRRRVRTRLAICGLQGKVDSLDICQSILAQLVRRDALNDVAGADTPDRFLARTVHNKILEVLRRYRADKRNARREVAETVDWTRVPGATETPSGNVIRREIYTTMLDSLDPEERRICRLRSEGRQFGEIAEEMRLTSDGVRMKYNRAVRRLRERYSLGE